MEKYEIIDDERNLFSNLDEGCRKCKKKCPVGISIVDNPKCGGSKRKRFLEIDGEKEVYFCSDSQTVLNSNRIFKHKIKTFKSMLTLLEGIKEEITVEVNKQNRRLFHNVISLNAHNIQELYAFVDQNTLTRHINEQREIIKGAIQSDLDTAANMFIRIAKNNAAMKTEFSVFKKLLDPAPTLHLRDHVIRKVLLNILHVFFDDFSNKNIKISVEKSEQKVKIDYESIHVVFYHILDNAVKYCLTDSTLYINFNSNKETGAFEVIFDMLSIEIKPGELTNLHREGFSGTIAKKLGESGDGVGMYIVKQILKLNNSDIDIRPNVSGKKIFRNGAYYTKNVFVLQFKT